MSFSEHLEELRKRLHFALIAPVILAIPTFFFGSVLLSILLDPIRDAMADAGLPDRVQLLSPLEPFVSYIKIALLAAVLLAAPFMMYQMWRFVAPGLHKQERRFAAFLVPGSLLLVVAGALFNYFVVIPLTLRVLVDFGQDLEPVPNLIAPKGADTSQEFIAQLSKMPSSEYDYPELKPWQYYFNTRKHQIRIKHPDGRMLAISAQADSAFTQQYEIKAYLSMILNLTFGFAVAFQLPLVLLLLGWIGLIDAQMLKAWRRYALPLAFVVSAVLTPPDVASQIVMGIPLYCLYELSIILLRLLPRSRSKSGGDDRVPVHRKS